MKIRERLFKNCIPVPECGCWIWIGHKNNKDGYGRIRIGGQKVLVHRVSYEVHFGNIPNGLCVCHKCDTPSCINPAHLFLGTVADNNRDRANKKRSADVSGDRHPMRKLSSDQAYKILATKGHLRRDDVADIFGVSKWAVADIWNRRTWKCLDVESIPADWRESLAIVEGR